MKKLYLLALLATSITFAHGQADLLSELSAIDSAQVSEPVIATFKSGKLINGPTVEMPAKRELLFLIQHRFGRLNGGAYEFFGLDDARVRLSLEYGLTENISLGIARSGLSKLHEGFTKVRFVRQVTSGGSPVSVSGYGSLAYRAERNISETYDNPSINRITYVTQLLVARKFSDRFSLQITPTLLHQNVRAVDTDPNTIVGVGAGARFKISKRVSINAEYYSVLSDITSFQPKDAISLGFDIETGGHVFQLHLTNSRGMADRLYLLETDGDVTKGDIHFGFNIARTFDFPKKR